MHQPFASRSSRNRKRGVWLEVADPKRQRERVSFFQRHHFSLKRHYIISLLSQTALYHFSPNGIISLLSLSTALYHFSLSLSAALYHSSLSLSLSQRHCITSLYLSLSLSHTSQPANSRQAHRLPCVFRHLSASSCRFKN